MFHELFCQPYKVNELGLPGFEIICALLPETLPYQANELVLPGFAIRVVLLLGKFGARHFIPLYLVHPSHEAVTPPLKGSPIRYPWDAILRRISTARGHKNVR